MQQHNLISIIKVINIETNLSYQKLLIDIIKNKIKYKSSISDYYIFKMYNLDSNIKNSLITKGINKKLLQINLKKNMFLYKKRLDVLKKYRQYFNRPFLELNGNNIAEFYDYVLKNSYFYAYDANYNNKEHQEIKIDLKNYTTTYNDLVLKQQNIIVAPIEESPKTTCLSSTDFNIFRFICWEEKILLSFLITSKNAKEKIYAPINIETGIIDYPGVDIRGNIYQASPVTNENLIWFQVTKWPRIKRMVKNILKVDPNLKYLEIDIILSTTGPVLYNINIEPNYIIYQLPSLFLNKCGLKNIFKKEKEI